jgi:hypothetical protein
MSKNERQNVDSLFFSLFFRTSSAITDEEVTYFREHPDQIDEVTAPVYIHRIFLWVGALLGAALVGLSKVLKYSSILSFLAEGAREFAIDLVYESGVALVGAAVTAYILGQLLNQQQKNAATWRAEIRRKIKAIGEG